jgi:hypothetical protein
VLREVRHPRTPNLGLAGHAGDVGTGAADPAALHKGGPPPRLRQMPSDQLASLSAPEDQYIKLFDLRHDFLRALLDLLSRCPYRDGAQAPVSSLCLVARDTLATSCLSK